MNNRRHIKAIILTGSRDFGRCPVASRLPTALWPLAGKPAIEHLMVHLVKQGISRAVICSNGEGALLAESIHADNHLKLKFLDELLSVGTAGAIRDAAGDEKDALLVILPAGIVCPPKIDPLISAHRDGQSDLTVMFNPTGGNDRSLGEPAGIYVCNPSILEHIPQDGYFDIKEGLIPALIRADKTVRAAALPYHVGNFRSRQEYLDAVSDYLENAVNIDGHLKPYRRNDSHVLWKTASVSIEQGARIYGPVVVMDDASICKGAVIFGPTILGRNVSISKDSVVVNSILWDNAQVGSSCQVQRCVVDYNAVVRSNSIVEEKTIAFKPERMLESSVAGVLKVVKNDSSKLQQILRPQLDKVIRKLPDWIQPQKTKIVPWLGVSVAFIAFLWSYWPGLVDLWNIWQRSDEYSSGLLVPFLAVYILWSRRHKIAQAPIRPCLWGILAFVGAQAVRLFGLFFMYGSAERLSITLSIAALVLVLFGWQLFRKVSTVLLFLCLMLPWPNRVQAAVALPLQRWATSSAVFCLETMGYEVIQEGNIIHIGQSSVAVAEACNGLRMVMAFFVVSGLVVLLAKRKWWEKLIVLASSLPIALFCNTIRLAITALVFTVLSGEYWEKVFHDFGGYAMMPLALAAVVAEFWLLAKLTTPPAKEQPEVIIRQER